MYGCTTIIICNHLNQLYDIQYTKLIHITYYYMDFIHIIFISNIITGYCHL